MAEISRRLLLEAAGTAAAALAGPGLNAAGTRNQQPQFGPAEGTAHLLFNENPYGPPPSAIRAMAEAAAKGCYYVDEVEPQLAALIATRFGVAPEQVVLGNGSFEVLTAAALAWGTAGTIVAPELMFDEPIRGAQRLGAKLARVAMAPDMGIDLPALAASARPGVSMIYICNPNNPTGMLIDPTALRSFIRSLDPRVTVLVDEAYNELTDVPAKSSVIDLVREGRNLIVTRTFSKIYGMAGLRIGYAIGSADHVRRIREHMLTIGPNGAGMAAAIAAYDDQPFLRYSRARILEGRGLLQEAVRRAGLRALPSQANFLFVEVPDADALKAAMAERGIAIRGAYGKWTRWSRVSTGRIEHVRRYADALPQSIRA